MANISKGVAVAYDTMYWRTSPIDLVIPTRVRVKIGTAGIQWAIKKVFRDTQGPLGYSFAARESNQRRMFLESYGAILAF